MIKRALSVLLTTGGILLVMLFLLPSSRVFAASSQVTPKSGFVNTCPFLGVTSAGILSGECYTVNHILHYSTLDLNRHVGNTNGVLVPNGAGFVNTCTDIGSFYPYDFYLGADCYTVNHTLHGTSLGLNAYVGNSNGNLIWA